MSDFIKTKISELIDLSSSEMDFIVNKFKTVRLKRREVLHDFGTICKDVYFLEEGLIRYFQVIEGEDITGQFFFEGGWYTDLTSFLHGAPSRQCVQAIESTTLRSLSKRDLYEIYDKIPKFERFGRLMAENAFVGLRKKTDQLTLKNAEERYLDLVKYRPKVTQRVPQHYIASYLGVKPQSLSRIRKRILKN